VLARATFVIGQSQSHLEAPEFRFRFACAGVAAVNNTFAKILAPANHRRITRFPIWTPLRTLVSTTSPLYNGLTVDLCQ